MTATKDLLNLAQALQTVVLVKKNIKATSKPKKNLTKLGIKNIVGIELLKKQAKLAGSID